MLPARISLQKHLPLPSILWAPCLPGSCLPPYGVWSINYGSVLETGHGEAGTHPAQHSKLHLGWLLCTHSWKCGQPPDQYISPTTSLFSNTESGNTNTSNSKYLDVLCPVNWYGYIRGSWEQTWPFFSSSSSSSSSFLCADKAAEGLIPAMPAADFLQHQKPSRHIRFRPRRLDSKFYDRSNPCSGFTQQVTYVSQKFWPATHRHRPNQKFFVNVIVRTVID